MRFVNQYYIKRSCFYVSRLSISCFIGFVVFKAVANLVGEALICADGKDRVKHSQIWFRFVQPDIIVQQRHGFGWGGGGVRRCRLQVFFGSF